MARFLIDNEVGVIDVPQKDNQLLIHPCPIKEKAEIKYTLLNDEFLTIELYDITGHFMKAFINNEFRSKGEHIERLYFDDSVPSGNYLLIFKNSTNRISIKIEKE